MDHEIGLSFDFEKADTRGGYVRGWASVVSVDGERFVDHSEDIIDIEVIRKSAHDFIADVRVAKAMHSGQPVGDIVESVIVDDEFAKALGASTRKRGWYIGMRVNDESIRERIRKGHLKAFSIGGRGVRTPITKHLEARAQRSIERILKMAA